MKTIIKLLFLLIFPLAFLLAVVLFIPYSGYVMVKLFLEITRKLGIHVLKTSVNQIPYTTAPDTVTVEFITDQQTYYNLRKVCNDHNIWFINPIWSALDAYKWVYSVMLVNKK